MLDFIVYFAMKGMSRTTLSLVGGWPQTWYDKVSNCQMIMMIVYMKHYVDLMLMLSSWSVCLELEWVWTWYLMWLSLLQECCVCSSSRHKNCGPMRRHKHRLIHHQLTITRQTLVTTEACVHQGFEPGT